MWSFILYHQGWWSQYDHNIITVSVTTNSTNLIFYNLSSRLVITAQLTCRIFRVAVANLAANGCRKIEMLGIVIVIMDTGFAIINKDSKNASNASIHHVLVQGTILQSPCRLKPQILTLEYGWRSRSWRSSKTLVLRRRTLPPGLQNAPRLSRTWGPSLALSSFFLCLASTQEKAYRGWLFYFWEQVTSPCQPMLSTLEYSWIAVATEVLPSHFANDSHRVDWLGAHFPPPVG